MVTEKAYEHLKINQELYFEDNMEYCKIDILILLEFLKMKK